jgi:hypothetical protein
MLLLVLYATAWGSRAPLPLPQPRADRVPPRGRAGRPESAPRRVLGGQANGVLAGLLAYHALAAGLVTTTPRRCRRPGYGSLPARSSRSASTSGILASDLRHAPSCATTLIVSLGLLSGLLQSGVIAAAVALLFATQAVLDPGERMVYILTNMINRIKRRGLLPSAVSFGVAGCLSSSTEEDEYPTATPDSVTVYRFDRPLSGSRYRNDSQ